MSVTAPASAPVSASVVPPSPIASPVFHSNPASPTSGNGGGLVSGGGLATGSAAMAAATKAPGITRTSTQMNSGAIAVGLKAAALPAVVKSGTLTKLGGNILSKWRLRWFILKENEFSYYESEKDYLGGQKPPLGRLIVDENLHCMSESESSLEWKFVSTEKTVVVRSTLPQKQEWYDAIERVTERYISVAQANGRAVSKKNGWTSAGRPPSPSVSQTEESAAAVDASLDGVDHSNVGLDGDDMFTAARETGNIVTVTQTTTTVTTAPLDDPSAVSISQPPLTPGLKVRAESSGSTRSISNTPRSSRNLSGQKNSFSIARTTLTPEELEKARTKRLAKSRKAQDLFGWPTDELLLSDYSCAIEKGIMLHGRLYISEHFVSFYSALFSGVKLCIPIADVIAVVEAKQALLFDNAIRIFVKPPQSSAVTAAGVAPESSYFFGSFGPGGRARALALMTSLINHTYSPAEYTLGLELSKTSNGRGSSGSSAGGGNTSDSEASQSRIEGIEEGEDAEDATTVEDGGEEEAGGASESNDLTGPNGAKLQKMSSRLDFGENRSAMEAQADALEFTELLDELFPTINARTFWRVFLSDAALYTGENYHASQGHTEYAASGWKDAKLVEGAESGGWQQVRDTMVRVPVVGSPMGPDSTRVLKVQKQRTTTGPPTVVEVETIAVTPDTPFADCFNLRDIWTITDDTSGPGCRLKIKFGINIHKSNWKLRTIKSILISRATGDNQKGFQMYVAEMKKYLAEHKEEVDAVAKVVEKSEKNKKGSAGGGASGKTPRKVAVTKASSATPAAAAAPAEIPLAKFGPLQPVISKLPPALQTVPAVAGIGLVILLLVSLIVYFTLFSGGESAATASTAGHYVPASSNPSTVSGASYLPPSPSSSSSTAASGSGSSPTIIMAGSQGTSNLVTCLLTLLVAAVGGLAYKVNLLEGEIARLRSETKKK